MAEVTKEILELSKMENFDELIPHCFEAWHSLSEYEKCEAFNEIFQKIDFLEEMQKGLEEFTSLYKKIRVALYKKEAATVELLKGAGFEETLNRPKEEVFSLGDGLKFKLTWGFHHYFFDA